MPSDPELVCSFRKFITNSYIFQRESAKYNLILISHHALTTMKESIVPKIFGKFGLKI